MIPNLKEPSLAPEPVPVPDPQSTPNPTSKKVPNRRRKTAIAPSVIRSDLGDDVQMSDSAVSSVAPSTRKDMEQARSDLSRNTSETRQNKSDAGKTGSKRAFQESPSHVAKSSKRLRVPPQKSKTTPGLNLGAHTFPEDSVVSTDLVPKLKGKVNFINHYCILFDCSTRFVPSARARESENACRPGIGWVNSQASAANIVSVARKAAASKKRTGESIHGHT